MFTLTGRAPDVPYASVGSGHSRTTAVSAYARQAGGSAHLECSDGASQARGFSGRSFAVVPATQGRPESIPGGLVEVYRYVAEKSASSSLSSATNRRSGSLGSLASRSQIASRWSAVVAVRTNGSRVAPVK
jgi:hypothetical protein